MAAGTADRDAPSSGAAILRREHARSGALICNASALRMSIRLRHATLVGRIMTNSSSHEPVKFNRMRLLEALLDSATDYAIIAMDLDGLVTSWNEGARRILGWTQEEMIGQPASVFFTLEDRQKGTQLAEMQNALDQGRGNDER